MIKAIRYSWNKCNKNDLCGWIHLNKISGLHNYFIFNSLIRLNLWILQSNMYSIKLLNMYLTPQRILWITIFPRYYTCWPSYISQVVQCFFRLVLVTVTFFISYLVVEIIWLASVVCFQFLLMLHCFYCWHFLDS